MTLEETIMDLTSRTPSGGSCWIGDTCFMVRYCSDAWEWEYRGRIYYDPQDLAEVILKCNGIGPQRARPQRAPHLLTVTTDRRGGARA